MTVPDYSELLIIQTDLSILCVNHGVGVTADDIQVQVESGNKLRVTGNISSYKASSNGSRTRTETANGNFVKLYNLPASILADKVRADVDDDGFITITVPKGKVDT